MTAALKNVRLGDILDIRDGTHDTPKYVEHGVPLITSKNLTDNGLCFRNISYISEDDHKEISKRSAVGRGDILYGMIGTIGKPTLVETDIQFSIKNVALFKLSNPEIDNRYFLYLLKSDEINKQISQASKGGTQKFVSLGALRDLKATLPSLPEQRRIAAILDKANALRAKRREAIAKLNQLLHSVFLEMFGDPVTNPKGWPVGKISDLLESAKYGSSEKADLQGEVPILRMNNITYSGEMNLTDLKYISRDKAEEKYSVMPGDILFNRTNSKELVGKTAVYEGPTPMAYAGYLVRARVANGHAPEYISAFMNSSYGKSTLQAMCKSIVGMANINAREFQAISIPIPPCELQQCFRSHVRAIRVRKRALELQSQKFDALFNSLQRRSFSGAN